MNLVERRKWLGAELQRELPEPVWVEVVDGGYVWAGDMTWDDEELLVDRARSYLRARRRGTPDSNSEKEDPTPSPFLTNEHLLRREVFAKCAAAMADEHPEVLAFREEILGALFPLTYGGALRFVDEDGHVRWHAPQGQRFADLAKTLAATYSWRAEDATWFVLCARYIPPLRTFGVETEVARHEHGPEIGTIRLTVEPWTPVDIVAQRYQEAQRRMLGKRPRQVGRETLRLLASVETMSQTLSWRKRMKLWNGLEALSKGECYKDVRNFRKAYKRVRALVLEPGYTTAKRNEIAARDARRRRIEHTLTSRRPY